MAELLLELFSEEIPARMQTCAGDDLKRLVTDKLKEAGLAFTEANAYTTPRRLALVVDGLPLAQPDVTEEKRGPRVGAPDQAVQGFLKSAGLTSLDQCEKRDTGKGEFWFAVVKKKGVRTSALLPGLLAESFAALPWPKSMRWAGHQYRWVRPLHSIVATFDGAVLDGAVDLGGRAIRFGNVTRGHRFHDPREITVAAFADYKVKLREAYVIVDPAERRAAIKAQTDKLAAVESLSVKPDEALLDEVTGLVEWPVALMGRIDEQYMEIPPEVLTTSMRVNQKYFSLVDSVAKLAPRFLVVANMETNDGGTAIVAGNERVLRARLSDAKFFWDQDRKVKLEERVPALKDIIFHARLGTVADKVSRIQTLAAELAAYIPGADVDQVRSAALLAKADLTTGMVGEFPELQGVMGRYYAMHEGEKLAVADAIAEHYAPLGPADRCPTAPVSVAVALADKIDSLVGFFAIDEKPTGSKDPFALRRAALGVIRIVLENGLRFSIRAGATLAYDIMSKQMQEQFRLFFRSTTGSFRTYPQSLMTKEPAAETPFYWGRYSQPNEDPIDQLIHQDMFDESRFFRFLEPHDVVGPLIDFFADRLKVALREKGVRHDLISAVFALGGEDDLVRLLARVDALKRFLDSEDGANLLVAYRRASNIVRIEEKKDGTTYNSGVDAGLLRQGEEKALHQALAAGGDAGGRALESEDFAGAMTALARLRQPVDAFFDKVTVNCEEVALRANRLRLLSEIRATLNRVADFSQIEG